MMLPLQGLNIKKDTSILSYMNKRHNINPSLGRYGGRLSKRPPNGATNVSS